MELKEKIVQRLREVIDPGTMVDVVTMGLIKNLSVTEDGNVSLEFQPSSSACPLALPLALDIQKSIKSLSEIKGLSVRVIDHQMADELNRYLKE